MGSPNPDIRVLADVAGEAAELFARYLSGCIDARGVVRVALAGGNTPRPVYERLARSPVGEVVNWRAVEVFQTDERAVPPSDADSNWGMLEDVLLGQVEVAAAGRHRMEGEAADLTGAAARYEAILHERIGGGAIPAFDLILLGLGEDGHTASLFPGTPAIDEAKRLVVANPVRQLDSTRLTLTFPVINAAREVWFLVTGSGKADAVRRVAGERDMSLPASRVRPGEGRYCWLLDRQAAAGLPQGVTRCSGVLRFTQGPT